MARIRSIKPEFWDDRKLARATSRDARMLYIGLWNQTDEHQRCNGDPEWIKGRVFPYDQDVTLDTVLDLLKELAAARVVEPYEAEGDPFLFLPKLGKHQRLEPGKVASKLPDPALYRDSTQIFSDEDASRLDEPAPKVDGALDRMHNRRSEADSSSAQIFSDESAHGADSPGKKSLLYVAGSMEHGAWSGEIARDESRDPHEDAKPPKTKRGIRLADDWLPTEDDVIWSRSQAFTDEWARRETEKFKNHFLSAPGAKGVKLDWSRTWRNWLMTSSERAGAYGGRSSTQRGTGDDQFAGAAQRMASREATL